MKVTKARLGGRWQQSPTDADRTYASGRRGFLRRVKTGRATEWDWSLSCGGDEIDGGVAFSSTDAKAACDNLERAEMAKCGSR